MVRRNTSAGDELLSLAMVRFGNLTAAEAILMRAAGVGTQAKAATQPGDQRLNQDSEWGSWEKWGAHRTVRAEVLRWLCVERAAAALSHPRGVQLQDARVEGRLDCEGTSITRMIWLTSCAIADGVELRDARVRTLFLPGCHVGGISADRVDVRGSMLLRERFSAKGEVRLRGAKIGGNLECDTSTFENTDGVALNADGIDVRGGVFLRRGFSAKGEVRLPSAKIGSVLDCGKGTFENASGIALNADGIDVRGGVFLNGGFSAKGEVRLLDARIGVLTCIKGAFENPDGDALSADRIDVRGGVFLREGFSAKGQVRLPAARIVGDLNCIGTIDNADRTALNADGIDVKGDVLLRNGFSSKGEVRLLGAKIGGSLECDNGAFSNAGGMALNADSIDVRDSVCLQDGFVAVGDVTMVNARIRNNFQCWKGSFTRDLDLDRATIGQTLQLSRSRAAPAAVSGVLDLSDARIARIEDCTAAWDQITGLNLHGLSYGSFVHGSPVDAKERLAWLRKGLGDTFLPQPYRQLARALARMGHEHEAVKVRQAEFRARRKSEAPKKWWHPRGRLLWTGRWLVDLALGCGFRPMRPLLFMVTLALTGWAVFAYANAHNLMVPASDVVLTSEPYVNRHEVPHGYEPMYALIYSLDAMLPFADLHQEKFWLPHVVWLRVYHWVHIGLGWTLGTFFAVGLVSLVRAKEKMEEGEGGKEE